MSGATCETLRRLGLCPHEQSANHVKSLSLYVWTGFSPDYTDGLAFAIAESVEKAQAMIEEEQGHGISIWGDLHIYPVYQPVAHSVMGGG